MSELVLNRGTSILFSYETPVAYYDGITWFKTDEYFSRTTSKHMNKHLPNECETVDSAIFNIKVGDLRL